MLLYFFKCFGILFYNKLPIEISNKVSKYCLNTSHLDKIFIFSYMYSPHFANNICGQFKGDQKSTCN